MPPSLHGKSWQALKNNIKRGLRLVSDTRSASWVAPFELWTGRKNFVLRLREPWSHSAFDISSGEPML